MPGMPLAEEVLRLVEALATTAQIQALLRQRKGDQDVRRRRRAAVASLVSCGQIGTCCRAELGRATYDYHLDDSGNLHQGSTCCIVLLNARRIILNKHDKGLVSKIPKVRYAVLLDLLLNLLEVSQENVLDLTFLGDEKRIEVMLFHMKVATRTRSGDRSLPDEGWPVGTDLVAADMLCLEELATAAPPD